MGGKGSGGYRPRSGSRPVPYRLGTYRIPKEYYMECRDEIKAVLKKYRTKCKQEQTPK